MSSRGSNPSSGTDGERTLSLDWGFWDKQLAARGAIHAGDHDVVVFRGGYGSGKTVLGARATLEIALDTPKSDSLVLAPDAQKGGPSTYKGFFKQLPGENVVPDEGGDPGNSPIVEDYHGTKRRLTLTNGAVIRLGSADVWNRYAGSEFNFIWCDEVAHYEHTDLYDLNRMLLSRQRTEQGPNVTLWTSTGNGYNQFYEFVEVQETPDGDALPTRLTNIVADSRDNPFLNEKEKLTRQFKGTGAEEQGLAGGFAAAEGLVYSQFSRTHHVIPESEASHRISGDWRIYGYDHGWDDPRVIVEIGKTSYDQYLVLDHYYRSEESVEDAITWLTENDKPTETIYAEHEPEHIEKFKRAGYPAESANKDLDEGIPTVRETLERDASGRPGLLISDACMDLIKEFQSYKEEHVGKSKATDHALDSLRYALMGDMYDTGPSGTGTWGGGW